MRASNAGLKWALSCGWNGVFQRLEHAGVSGLRHICANLFRCQIGVIRISVFAEFDFPPSRSLATLL